MKRTLLLTIFALPLFSWGLSACADTPMAGMKMAPKPAPLSVTATVNPAAPRSGDNTLDLMIVDSTGKPVTGLKLTASVAMTSMDMGTTHPAVTDMGNGRYGAKVNFSMNGPWRVVVRNGSGKVAVLDFESGSKTPWKSPAIQQAVAAPSQPAVPAVNTPPTPMPNTPPTPVEKPMPGMDMKSADMKGMSGIADMKTATIPELKEKGTYTATGDENWEKQTGFGKNAGMVGMMNQMMVGGSGMEGMKMAPMTLKFDEQNYAKPSPDDTDTGSMAGMKMDAPTIPNTPASAAPVTITATTAAAPKAGDNPLTIHITDAQGKPVTGAVITTSVAMTSMDMGTTHPTVKEKGAGQYAATATFSMAGPWRVNLKVTLPGQKPQTKAFDFTAK